MTPYFSSNDIQNVKERFVITVQIYNKKRGHFQECPPTVAMCRELSSSAVVECAVHQPFDVDGRVEDAFAHFGEAEFPCLSEASQCALW